jgi:hypothetical protein
LDTIVPPTDQDKPTDETCENAYEEEEEEEEEEVEVVVVEDEEPFNLPRPPPRWQHYDVQ